MVGMVDLPGSQSSLSQNCIQCRGHRSSLYISGYTIIVNFSTITISIGMIIVKEPLIITIAFIYGCLILNTVEISRSDLIVLIIFA